MSVSTAHVTCLCGAVRTPFAPLLDLSVTSLPLSSGICYCDTCRYSSGCMGAILLNLASAPPEDQLAQCVPYASSAKVTRYFCRTCGSKTFIVGSEGDEGNEVMQWALWGGLVEQRDGSERGDVNKVDLQIFVADALDGALWGRMVKGMQSKGEMGKATAEGQLLGKVYEGGVEGHLLTGSEQIAFVDKARKQVEEKRVIQANGDEKLLGRCHCGVVEFHVLKPRHIKEVDYKTEWFLREKNTKYVARLCACRSCRLGSGHPLQAWTYVPPECILTIDGKQLYFDSEGDMKAFADIKTYRSSEGIRRTFCGTCGASAFYEWNRRPFMINISIGILRSEVGSLAEDWLVWEWDDISHREECCDRELLNSITGSS